MSVFTSRVTDVLPIPHDAGHSVTIRKLAPRHLHAAQKAAQLRALADLRDMGGAAFMKELKGLSDTPDEVKRIVRQADPLATYDEVTLIEKGVASWTYKEPLTRESFEDLDDVTQTFIARAVLKLSKPELFLTAEEAEDEKKSA